MFLGLTKKIHAGQTPALWVFSDEEDTCRPGQRSIHHHRPQPQHQRSPPCSNPLSLSPASSPARIVPSIGNGLLAWAQCLERGVPHGPIATYSRWQALGRQGKAAAKATSLRIPVTLAREEGGGRRRKTRRQTDRADAGADPTVGLPRRLARAATYGDRSRLRLC